MAEKIESLKDIKAATSAAPAEVKVRKSVKDKQGRSYATGKRKDAVAQKAISPLTINQLTNILLVRF